MSNKRYGTKLTRIFRGQEKKDTLARVRTWLTDNWRSVQYVAMRYKWHLLASIGFFLIFIAAIIIEFPVETVNGGITTIFQAFLGQLSSGITFSTTPLTFIMIRIAPAFLAGVLVTAAMRFFRDLTGAEFEAIRSWNSARTKIYEISDHFIVVGLGRVGLNLTQILHESGYKVIATDLDPNAKIKRPLSQKTFGWVHFPGFAARRGKELEQQIPAIWTRDGDICALAKAGIGRARSLCLMSSNFGTNLFIVINVRKDYPDLTIVARVNDENEAEILDAAGVDLWIEPKSHGAKEIVSLLEIANPNIIKVSGIIPESEFLPLIKVMDEKGFYIIRMWRWKVLQQRCQVRMLIQTPETEIPEDMFPEGLRVES
ncbi:MAG: NAD-binding protein [Candidatus Odinarchaeota archaeon]